MLPKLCRAEFPATEALIGPEGVEEMMMWLRTCSTMGEWRLTLKMQITHLKI
jgi:hypothetical protein